MSLVWTWKAVIIFFTFLNLYVFVIIAGERCQSLDGKWYSHLGSQLSLNHSEEGLIFGHYKTALEREFGSISTADAQLDIIGAAPYNDPGAVFGFSVMWNNGASIKSWTGQCLICGNNEVLETSWLLRQRVDGCSDKWQSTNIGQTLFTRQIHGSGNEKAKHDVSDDGYDDDDDDGDSSEMRRRKRDIISDAAHNVCSLNGYWYNERGSEMFITVHQNTTVIGEYRTAVELQKGSAGRSHSKVYGVANAFDPNSTIALYVVWNNGASITGWVGISETEHDEEEMINCDAILAIANTLRDCQCHLCGENQTETLMMTWLLRSKVNSCDENWKATLYGESTFTRHEGKMGPRRRLGIHTPGELGEVLNGSNSIYGKSKYKPHMLPIMCVSVLSIILNYAA